MKTTIDLPESLHRRARERAAEQGISPGEIRFATFDANLPASLVTRGSQAVDEIPV